MLHFQIWIMQQIIKLFLDRLVDKLTLVSTCWGQRGVPSLSNWIRFKGKLCIFKTLWRKPPSSINIWPSPPSPSLSQAWNIPENERGAYISFSLVTGIGITRRSSNRVSRLWSEVYISLYEVASKEKGFTQHLVEKFTVSEHFWQPRSHSLCTQATSPTLLLLPLLFLHHTHHKSHLRSDS